MALTTRAAVKAYLNIPTADTTLDAWLDAVRPGAEATIKRYLGRDLEQASYTEYYAGANKNWFTLRQFPVASITSLYYDPDGWFGTNPSSPFDATKLLTEGVDYALDLTAAGRSDTGVVWRINDVWPHWRRDVRPGTLSWVYHPSRGNIKVTYVAGYATIPDDLQMAVALLVGAEMKSLPNGGPLVSERIGDYSYEMAGERMMGKLQVLGSLRQLLSRYRDPL